MIFYANQVYGTDLAELCQEELSDELRQGEKMEKALSEVNENRDNRYWYAVYTRARFEKRINTDFERRNLKSFLPLHQVRRIWSDRIKVVEEPLFPSYVFVYADAKERYAALQSVGVVRMVSFNGTPVRIAENQIQAIYSILENGCEPEPYQYLKYGDEVEIICGPLQGLRGYFLEERGLERLAVSIHEIQQTFVIQVQRGKVRKINGDRALRHNLPYHNGQNRLKSDRLTAPKLTH